MAGYYDYVLAVIPAAILAPLTTALAFGVPLRLAFLVGSAIAVPFVGHAMFVRGPTGTDDTAGDDATETTTSAPPTAD